MQELLYDSCRVEIGFMGTNPFSNKALTGESNESITEFGDKKIDKAISSSRRIKEELKTLRQQIAQLDKDNLHVGQPKELDKLVEIEISFDKSMPMQVCEKQFSQPFGCFL